MSSTGKKKEWRLTIAMVILPMILAAVYYGVFAVDRYVSSAQVVVRQDGGTPGAQVPGLATLLTGANPASREETLYLREFITSMDMMLLLEEKAHWIEQFSAQRSDVFFWLDENAPRENLLKYYQRMVSAHYDETTGLLRVEVQAFTPELSEQMLRIILQASEHFVNEVSHNIAREQMKFAQSELESARINYAKRKTELMDFQNINKVLDGANTAQSRATIIADLESQYTKEQASLTEMSFKLRSDAPQIRQQKQKVEAITQQLAKEKRLLVSSPKGSQLNVVASRFQQLTLDAGIAEETYKASVAALDNARIEASKKIRTLVTVVSPNTPQLALYPERWYNLATILLGLLMLYGITRFILASIEDHRD
ncbi:ABC transporter permease [Pseudomonas sp. SWRI100]|jgi:Capsule polysaccharide export protein|uniref:ABC transporter permease n=1 Tax=Pseudomonas TaxID=286 RepID=UPI00048044B1|nr:MULTISPECIES: ABC transporter permease [Pseudomonas]ATP49078.1 ABC transporter permease [Pseudomonas putida]MBC3498842.1 ABC transporter permease [Pseudomonas sp. SWRI67]MBV4525497.1 ABC transporter permease [Pseudomonas kermanshahensis]MDE4540828.1 ABC transporter permease [Pseudomonas sp. ITEM 17296]USS57338.1 ABC transporter permease [Pseudomonas kermanshahensis]